MNIAATRRFKGQHGPEHGHVGGEADENVVYTLSGHFYGLNTAPSTAVLVTGYPGIFQFFVSGELFGFNMAPNTAVLKPRLRVYFKTYI